MIHKYVQLQLNKEFLRKSKMEIVFGQQYHFKEAYYQVNAHKGQRQILNRIAFMYN